MTVACPFEDSKQVAFITLEVVLRIAGCVMLKVAVAEHPLASVIEHVYVPAVNPDAVAAVPPEGAQQ